MIHDVHGKKIKASAWEELGDVGPVKYNTVKLPQPNQITYQKLQQVFRLVHIVALSPYICDLKPHYIHSNKYNTSITNS